MKPVNHIIGSAISGSIFYFGFNSLSAAITCFIFGVLIDMDHFIDYFLYKGLTFRGIRDFYITCEELNMDRIYLFFHSNELVIILWILIFVFHLNLIWIALAVGISQHMLLDQLGNKCVRLAYFFTYRLSRGFKTRYLFIKNG